MPYPIAGTRKIIRHSDVLSGLGARRRGRVVEGPAKRNGRPPVEGCSIKPTIAMNRHAVRAQGGVSCGAEHRGEQTDDDAQLRWRSGPLGLRGCRPFLPISDIMSGKALHIAADESLLTFALSAALSVVSLQSHRAFRRLRLSLGRPLATSDQPDVGADQDRCSRGVGMMGGVNQGRRAASIRWRGRGA